MAIRLSIGELFRIGAPVSFWASVAPSDPPVTLPSANPYEILSDGALIHQPLSPEGEARIKPNYPLIWRWDQKDQGGAQVPPGRYNLRFFGPEPIDSAFSISSSTPNVIKSGSKWLRRTCQFTGPVVMFLDPISGTIVSILSVPFELIENDPPRHDVDILAEPVELEYDSSWVDNYISRRVLTTGLSIVTRLLAMQTTIERHQGALELGKPDWAARQEQHIDYLGSDVASYLTELSSSIMLKSAELGEHYGGKAFSSSSISELSASLESELEKQYAREILHRAAEKAGDGEKFLEIARGLGNAIRSLDWEDKSPELILREFQFEAQRFSDTISPPRPMAQAA